MIQVWSDESLYLPIIFMHFYCFIFVMGFKMQYSTLFVCVYSHDQVMDIWCFRFVWRFSCLQEECEHRGSPNSLASATQISDFAREHVCCTQQGALQNYAQGLQNVWCAASYSSETLTLYDF